MRDGLDGSGSSKMSMSHRGSLVSREDVPAQPSPLDRFRATTSVMYESALTEAAALGHAGNGLDSVMGSDGKPTSPSPRLSTKDGNGRSSALDELGDFF